MKRIRSGVEVPEAKDGFGGAGGARLLDDVLGMGDRREAFRERGAAIVVLRVIFVVSAEGGGGRCARLVGEKRCARQRKHSPVPK